MWQSLTFETLFSSAACIKQLMEGKSMNNRFSQNIPNLGSIQPSSAGSTEAAEEIANNSDRNSLIGRNNECVICMDNQRGTFSNDCTSILAFYNLFNNLQIASCIRVIICAFASSAVGCCSSELTVVPFVVGQLAMLFGFTIPKRYCQVEISEQIYSSLQ